MQFSNLALFLIIKLNLEFECSLYIEVSVRLKNIFEHGGKYYVLNIVICRQILRDLLMDPLLFLCFSFRFIHLWIREAYTF
jgi:hypothetical protein